MINFVVKPVATYAGVSDTNGGGFSDTYDAVYATFCNSDGSALYDSTFSALSGSGGTYSLDITSTTNCVTGVICRIDITEGSAGYFYGEITAITDGDTLAIAYVPVGDTSALAQAAVDSAISGGNDTGNITVGGALATIEAGANLAKADGHTVLIEGPATYVRTAGITDVVNLIVMGVDASGDVAIGDDRLIDDLATNNIQYGWTYASGTCYLDILDYIAELHSASGVTTALVYSPDADVKYMRLSNGKFYADARNSTYVTYGNQSLYTAVNCKYINLEVVNLYGLELTSQNMVFSIVAGCEIDVIHLLNGRFTRTAGVAISNSIIRCSTTTSVYGLYSNKYINNIFIAHNTTDILVNDTSETNSLFNDCIFIGYDDIVADASGLAVNDCAFYDMTIPAKYDTAKNNNLLLSADPFVDSANGDYRLDPAGPDFDKLYDTLNGRVLIGATGPEMTTGTGGTGVCNLIGNGGMIE